MKNIYSAYGGDGTSIKDVDDGAAFIIYFAARPPKCLPVHYKHVFKMW